MSSTLILPGHEPAPPAGLSGPGFEVEVELLELDALAWAPADLLIGGQWRAARGDRRLMVEDPATGAALSAVADADAADCLEALSAAAQAQAAWAQTAPRERSRILRRAADGLRAEEDRLAMIGTLEMGKPLAESRAEVTFAADYLEWYAEEAVRISGRAAEAPEGGARHLVHRRAGRTVAHRDALELPPGRPGAGRGARARGRLHRGPATRVAGPALGAGARAGAAGRGTPGRGAQRGRLLRRRRHRPPPRRPAPAQAHLHRLVRGGAAPAGAFARPSSCGRRSSSADARRSWSSPTPISTPRSTGRSPPRCATGPRRAPRPTASTRSVRWRASSPGGWPSGSPRCAWAAAPSPAPNSGR